MNVALPSIQEDLGFSQSNLAWVVNAYLIPFGGLLLLAGRLGDLLGQRRVFLVGLGIFTVASALCAASPDQAVLIGARFIQGIGGALSSAVILAMIVRMFQTPNEQAKAIGVYGFVASAGGSIGLLLGGILTQAISWHFIFVINLPIGVLVGWLALRLVDNPDGLGMSEGADFPGAALITAALMLGVFTILQITEWGWVDPRTIGGLVLAAALLVAFVRRQSRIANPLMPLRLFASRNVVGANTVQALLVAGMFGMFFLGALYLERGARLQRPGDRPRLPADHGGDGRPLPRLLGKADHALWPAQHPHPRLHPGDDRAAALRPHPGRRQLPDRPAAAVPADRHRHRHLVPGDHDPGDVGSGRRRTPGSPRAWSTPACRWAARSAWRCWRRSPPSAPNTSRPPATRSPRR